MKGLIIKDLYTLKKLYKNYLFVLLIFAFTTFSSKNPYMFSSMLFILSFMLPITVLSLDDHYNWQKYALTLPVSKIDLVISKYILGAIFGVISAIITTIIVLVLPNSNMSELGACLCIFFTMGLVFLSIMFPLILKFGVEKARILIFAVVAIPMIFAGGLAFKNKHISIESIKQFEDLIWFLPLLGLIIACISIYISIKVLDNKEF